MGAAVFTVGYCSHAAGADGGGNAAAAVGADLGRACAGGCALRPLALHRARAARAQHEHVDREHLRISGAPAAALHGVRSRQQLNFCRRATGAKKCQYMFCTSVGNGELI